MSYQHELYKSYVVVTLSFNAKMVLANVECKHNVSCTVKANAITY